MVIKKFMKIRWLCAVYLLFTLISREKFAKNKKNKIWDFFGVLAKGKKMQMEPRIYDHFLLPLKQIGT